jgi:hypothetical protein
VEDAFCNSEMGLMRVVHVKARLSDCVGDVMLSEVLESPDQATVGSQVTDRGIHVIGDLGLSVHRRCMVCSHSSHHTYGYPERIVAGAGRDSCGAAPLRC